MVNKKIVIKDNDKKVCEIESVNPKFDDLIKYISDNREKAVEFKIECEDKDFDKEEFKNIIDETLVSFKSSYESLKEKYDEVIIKLIGKKEDEV